MQKKFLKELYNQAIIEAKKSDMFFQLSAIIFKGKKILSYGYNYDYNQKIIRGEYSVHAERHAINIAKKNKINIQGANMLVIRLANHKHGNKLFNNAEPCNICKYHIKKNKIKNVYYTIT